MDSQPKPFDADAPAGGKRGIIRRNPANVEEIEMVEAIWGSDPRLSDGASFRFIRSEEKSFSDNRCLLPASDFRMRVGKKNYRVTLDTGNFFYLAAIWSPPLGDWPLSFRIITVAANPEVARFQSRHGAIIHRRQVMPWLDLTISESELIATPPAHSFVVEELGKAGRQTLLPV